MSRPDLADKLSPTKSLHSYIELLIMGAIFGHYSLMSAIMGTDKGDSLVRSSCGAIAREVAN